MRRRLGWIRTGLLAAAVVTAVAFQVASAPAAVGVFSLDRLRVENAGGAEDYVYTAGKVIFPEGGADTGSYYRFVVTDATGTTRNSPVCRPASDFPTANNAYTVATTDPSSTATAWRYTLNQYVGSSCTGTPAKTAFKSFYVAKATTFSDAGLTTLRNAFHVGETAYVVLSGVKPSSDQWAVTWFLPSGALACANTAGTDRPDSRANGTLPKTAGTFLQFRPNTTSSGSAWNRESNYETRPCPTFAAGNQGAWTVRVQFDATNVVTLPAFVVDTTPPPTPTIDARPADPTNATSATFAFSDSEPGASFLCQRDGAAFASCSSPRTYTALAPGTHTFAVKARDAAGNEGGVSSFTWTIDTAAPAAPSIDSHPPTLSNSASASFTFSGESGASFLCQLDGSSFAACTSPKNYSGLAEGGHAFAVKARNAAGNESAASSFTWSVDLTAPPAPSIDSHPPDPSNSASASFTFSDGEGGVSFRCALDSGGFAPCTSPASYSNLSETQHSFAVKALDAAGNESAPSSYTWFVSIAPIVTLASPTNGSSTSDATPTFAGQAGTQFGDSQVVTVNVYAGTTPTGPPVESLAAVVDPFGAYSADASPALTDGSYTARVEQSDAGGSTGFSTANTFVVDTTAPAVPTINTHPADPSNSASASFGFSAETGATFLCQLDGSGFSACTSPKSYSGLGEGAHSFGVKARDAAGNESTAASFSWTVDTAGPAEPSIDSHPADPSNSASASFSFSGETGATFLCQLDGGGFSACTSPKSYSGLANGAHSFGVKARDAGGNESTVTSFGWTVDTTAPAITLASPANSSTTSDSTPTFSGSAGSLPGDSTTVTVRVYQGSNVNGTPIEILITNVQSGSFAVDASPALADGTYTAQAQQGDAAGNLGVSSANTFVVDTTIQDPTPPVVTLTQPTDGSSMNDTTPTFGGIAGTASGDLATVTVKVYAGSTPSGSPVQTLVAFRDGFGNYTVDATALAESLYTAQAEQQDVAGNLGRSAPASFTIDATPPAAPAIGSRPADPSNSASASFGFTGDAGATFLCQLDGGGFSACTSPKSYSGLGEGAHSFGVKARDAAGNESTVTTFSWTIDTVPPSAPSIDSHPPVATTSSAASFTFSGGSGASFLCQLDGSGFSACTSPKNYSGLAEGAHSFQVKARDVAGNESTPASFSWTIDGTLPIITLTSPADGSSSSNANPTFSGVAGTASGDSASVVVEVYPGSVITGTPVRTLNATAQPNGVYTVTAGSALNEGTYTARAEQQDAAGNLGMSTANTFVIGTSYRDEVSADGPRSYWRLDESSGTVAADQTGANGGTYVGGVTLAQAGALAGDTNTSALFDGVNDYVTALDSSSLDLTTAVGVEAWVKRTKSAAYQVIVGKPGNGQSKFENYALWLDTSNRVIGYFGDGVNFVSVVGPAIDTNWHHVVTTYDNATAKIYVDGTLRASTASTIRLTANALPLNIGRASSSAYYFGGRIDELAVYPSALSAQRVQAHYNAGIGADTRPPLVTLTSPANGSTTNNSTPTLTGLAGSAGGDSPTVTVKVYSGGSPIGTPVRTLTATRQPDTSYAVDLSPQLADGTYTARAEQTDAAGNVGLSSANTFTVAGTAPVVTLTTPADGTSTSNRTPTFSGTAGTGPGDSPTVFVKIYPGSTPTGTPVQTLTTTRDSAGPYSVAAAAPLADGTYTAQAEQTGLDGSVGRSSAPTFRIDNIAPSVVLTAPANGSTTGRTTPSFSGTAGTALGDLASVTVKLYAGPDTTGTLLQTLTAAVGEGGAYSVPASPPLTPGIYTARTDQSDSAGNLEQSSANTFTVTADAPVLLAAGDIADCPPTGAQATAAILDANPDAIVAALGDTAYNNGQPSEYTNCYDPSWGRAKARTRPMIGDHEYGVVSGGTPPGVGFVNYFHDQLAPFGPNALDPAKLYYSYDLGAWHIVVLNVQCYEGVAPGCNPGLQEQWFENDLAANPTDCTVVMWHKPRFSSGSIHGDYFPSQQFWETSYDHGVELVFSGDDHLYERFARMDAVGNADPQYGVRQFVLGMGGYSHYSFSTIQPNSQVRNSDAYGLLKLTLHPASYDWQFLPEAGRTFTDSGSETCHAPPPAPPAGAPTVRSVSSSIANHPSSSLTIAKPAGTTQGDVLLAFGGHQSGSATNLAAPAGWTAVPNTDYSDANNARIHAWYKIAGAIEPASYTFTLSGGGQAIAGGMMAITGATATPINASLGQVNGTNSIFLTAPSITTTAAKTLLVYGGAVNAPVSITPPGFMHEQFDVATNGAFNLTIGAATQVIASAGSTGVRTAYLSSAAHGPAFLIAIAPSAP
jgi:hypothetical protein